MEPAAPQRTQDRDQPRELAPEEMDLYRELAEHGPLRTGRVLDGPAPGDRPRTLDALDSLVARGLVQQIGPDSFAAANPADISAELLKRWEERVQGAQLDLLRMRGQLAELAIVHASHQRTLEGPPLERVESPEELRHVLDRQASACVREVLRAQPGGPLPATGSHRTGDRDLLSRGVRVHTLYQHSARFDAPTVRYEAELAAHGAEARTVSGGLAGFQVFDRSLLVLPLRDAPGGALLVRGPDLVAFAAESFAVLWATGEALGKPREKAFIQDVADQARRSILQHLVQGDDDRVTARALGISVRTCQRHVSAIMRQLGATSRFQLGYLAHRHGLLDADGQVSAAGPVGSAGPVGPGDVPLPPGKPTSMSTTHPAHGPVPTPPVRSSSDCAADTGTWIRLSRPFGADGLPDPARRHEEPSPWDLLDRRRPSPAHGCS
ncbi:LuxR C-terminal-related transcriptional regulator [Streptomyces sp. NPDC091201]|uniref:helix-turn-helix transcriptional regulator n=1 Tax=Streptomyces sp. NPDC091201 TaxID=3155190 RepID=UPI00343AD17F